LRNKKSEKVTTKTDTGAAGK